MYIYILGAGGLPGTLLAPWVFIYIKLLHGWCYVSSGVGWGGDDNVACTCIHGRCYARSCFLHLHAWLVLRNIMFLALAHMVGATQDHVSCTCRHGRCYAISWGGVGMIMLLALAYMVGVTQDHVSCTCMHDWCYVISCFLHLHTWSVLRKIMFLALADMVGATQYLGVGWG